MMLIDKNTNILFAKQGKDVRKSKDSTSTVRCQANETKIATMTDLKNIDRLP